MSALLVTVYLFVLGMGQADLDLDSRVETAITKSVQEQRAGKNEDAIKALTELEPSLQNSYLVEVRLGLLYYLGGKYDASRTHYEEAVKLSPVSKEARLGLILAVLGQGHFAYAETLARQALEIDPQNYFANLRLAYALRMQAKLKEAGEIDSRMLDEYPSDISFLLERGLVHVASRQPVSAKKVFQRVLMLDPTNPIARQQIAK